jgi:hypothetical protein
MLLTGESVTATTKATGVPKQTINRWNNVDLPAFLRPSWQPRHSSPVTHMTYYILYC